MFVISLERAEHRCCSQGQGLTRISQITVLPGKGQGTMNHHWSMNAKTEELCTAGYFLLTTFRHMKINSFFLDLDFCCAWRQLRLWAQFSNPLWKVSLVLHATLFSQSIFHTEIQSLQKKTKHPMLGSCVTAGNHPTSCFQIKGSKEFCNLP